MKIRIEIPTTRKVYGTTTFEAIIDDEKSRDEVLSLFNTNKKGFIDQIFETFDADIVEEFDNHSEITESDYERAGLDFPGHSKPTPRQPVKSPLLSHQEAKYLRISKKTLVSLVRRGGIHPVQLSPRRIAYLLADLDLYIKRAKAAGSEQAS